MSSMDNKEIKINLNDLLYRTADRALDIQNEDGSFPAGHNGVRYDPETPVRNTGHWLITLLKVFENTKDERFLAASRKALNYLLSDAARPMHASFWHRYKPEKDFCNGLMGQAYTIESLSIAFEKLKDACAANVAEEVFLLHPFNESLGLWQRVAVDGSYLPPDFTFNHQLWFAAAGALLYKATGNNEIKKRVLLFMDSLNINLNLYKIVNSGLIIHSIDRDRWIYEKMVAKQIVHLKKAYNKKKIKHAMAYHGFNMYAFSLLNQVFYEHKFWNSNKFKDALAYFFSKGYKEKVENPSFYYPYSPAGFETAFIERAFALSIFGSKECNISEQERLLSLQFYINYDFDSNFYKKNTTDVETCAARIYKVTRLQNISFKVQR